MAMIGLSAGCALWEPRRAYADTVRPDNRALLSNAGMAEGRCRRLLHGIRDSTVSFQPQQAIVGAMPQGGSCARGRSSSAAAEHTEILSPSSQAGSHFSMALSLGGLLAASWALARICTPSRQLT
jgi:hypothetical protein